MGSQNVRKKFKKSRFPIFFFFWKFSKSSLKSQFAHYNYPNRWFNTNEFPNPYAIYRLCFSIAIPLFTGTHFIHVKHGKAWTKFANSVSVTNVSWWNDQSTLKHHPKTQTEYPFDTIHATKGSKYYTVIYMKRLKVNIPSPELEPGRA